MNQSMQHLFAQIPRADIQRSVFDRSHTLKTAFDSGYLVPIFVDEALPGDTFVLDLSLFGRLSTMAVPVMDNLYLETFFFAVPNRLVWDNWQRFCGEQTNPGDSTDYLVPILEKSDYGSPIATVGSLYDYLGIPTQASAGMAEISSLWCRAYNLIWNEWFRDENLQDSVSVPKGDGPDDRSLFTLLKRGKRHDYFTSCLPWPQKGPGVGINLAGSAPVYGDGLSLALKTDLDFRSLSGLPTLGMRTADYQGGTLAGHSPLLSGNIGGTSYSDSIINTGGTFTSTGVATKSDLDGASSGLLADLSQASAVTINDLRTAFQIQRLYEADARGGKFVCLHVKKIAEKNWKAA